MDGWAVLPSLGSWYTTPEKSSRFFLGFSKQNRTLSERTSEASKGRLGKYKRIFTAELSYPSPRERRSDAERLGVLLWRRQKVKPMKPTWVKRL